MAGFSSLSISGYRRLKIVDTLRLQPLNVLIGANGVGKSSVLGIFDLLASSAEGRLENTIVDSGGLDSILTADDRTKALTLGIDMDVESRPPMQYQLRLVRQGYGYVIAQEELSQHRRGTTARPFKYIDSAGGSRVRYHQDGKLVAPTWNYNWPETALSQVPKMYQEAEEFRRLLANISEIYHVLDVSERAPIRLPQTLSSKDTPGSNGEDLISTLLTMRETKQDRYEAVLDALSAAFPNFERLEFQFAPGGTSLAWHDRNLSRAIQANELSEGTLRFLWLATLLQSPGLPRITLIDEPEVSLHPEMLRLLAELMREAAQRTQLVVATHSDRFIRFLQSDELLVCDLDEDGATMIRRGSELDIAAWLGEYTLDQLWAMGRLGGRM